jgi:hypothetical protein
MKSTIANVYRLITARLARLIVGEPIVAAQIIEPKHGVAPTRQRSQLSDNEPLSRENIQKLKAAGLLSAALPDERI